MKNKLDLTLGSDPELMIHNTRTMMPCSAINVLQNDKHNPIDLGDGAKMYADNVLVECSFPPSNSKDQMIDRLKIVFAKMQQRLGSGYRLLPKTAHTYCKSELEHPMAWQSGCDPNFDVYAKGKNHPAGFKDGLRTGSFHLHIGNRFFKKKDQHLLLTPISKSNAVRIMDMVVGCASVVFDRDDTSIIRRKLYGRAGEFRPTPYGIEYRVLGNYALRSPDLTMLVLDLTTHAMSIIERGQDRDLISSIDEAMVVKAINTNSFSDSVNVLHKCELPGTLMRRVMGCYNPSFHKDWGINA